MVGSSNFYHCTHLEKVSSGVMTVLCDVAFGWRLAHGHCVGGLTGKRVKVLERERERERERRVGRSYKCQSSQNSSLVHVHCKHCMCNTPIICAHRCSRWCLIDHHKSSLSLVWLWTIEEVKGYVWPCVLAHGTIPPAGQEVHQKVHTNQSGFTPCRPTARQSSFEWKSVHVHRRSLQHIQ